MSFDKEKLIGILNEGANRVQKAAAETKETLTARYQAAKLRAELEDLYLELGIMINRAYNDPGSVPESEVVALNGKINWKVRELNEVKGDEHIAADNLCSACGKPLQEDHVFCPYCGAKKES